MKKKVSAEDARWMKKLRLDGMTIVAIAKKFSVSTVTVCDYTTPGFYEKRKKAARDRLRRNTLFTGGGMKRGLSKREYPGKCELCGKEMPKGLAYHHWDDNNLSMGIWLCNACHRIAEFLDKAGWAGVARAYLALRKRIQDSLWDTE